MKEQDRALEVYRQRYETWRHLDKVRYQLIQVAVAAGAALAIFVQANDGEAYPLALIIFAGVLLLLWKILAKVNDAIVSNGAALKDFGNAVGDDRLPDVSKRVKSVFYYTEWILFFAGAIVGIWGLVAGVIGSA